MRIAAMVLGLMLSAWVFVEGFFIAALNTNNALSRNSQNAGNAAGGGILAAIVGAVAAALALAAPRVSVILFAVAAGISFITAAAGYGNHAVYGILFCLLAVMSYRGWREKLNDQRLKVAEVQEHRERDGRMEQLLRQSQQPAGTHCPSCGQTNPTGTRFCGSCGTPLVVEKSFPRPVVLSNNSDALPKGAASNGDPKSFFDGIAKTRDRSND